MKYYCVENNCLISVLDYYPSVSDKIRVFEISDEHHRKVEIQSHYFDVASGTIHKYSEDDKLRIANSELMESSVSGIMSLDTAVFPFGSHQSLEFLCEKSDGAWVLRVINNTDADMIASASTTVGSFSEVRVASRSTHTAQAVGSEHKLGFLMYKTVTPSKART